MNKKLGFSLVEVVIALLLSCIIVGFLINTLGIIQRGLRSAHPLIEHTEELTALYQQLVSDVEGMCVPLQSKTLQKVCWSNSQQEHLSYFTFISNNPLQFYSDQHVQDPYLVRIAYYLKKESNATYSLYRAQSNNLSEWSEQYMSKYGYKIYGSIRHISTTFYASYYKDKKKSLYQANVWQYDEWVKKNKSLGIVKIPQWIGLSIIFEHATEPFNVDIQIPIYESLLDVKQSEEHSKKESAALLNKVTKQPSELQKALEQLKNMQSKAVS